MNRWTTCVAATAVTAAFVGTGITGAAPPSASAATADQPNILIVNLDDLRASGTLDVMPTTRSFFADGGRTYPNSFLSTPLCSPSRASLFTGRYGHNNGVTGNGLDAEIAAVDQSATIQGYLNADGYNTALAGKYMNTVPLSRSPQQWDRWLFQTGGYENLNYNQNGTVRRLNGYYTDVLGDNVVNFLQGFESTDDTPWLMYVAPQAPHSPTTPSAKYANAPVPAFNPPPNFNEADVSDKPAAVRSKGLLSTSSVNSLRTSQLRTLMSVDDLIGRIVAEMDRLDETRRTLAIFTSDNGSFWGEHRLTGKRFPYTDSVRAPLYVRWPGHIAPGSTDQRLVSNVDMLPTVLGAAGVSPTLKYPLDGTSFLNGQARSRLLLEYGRSLDAPLAQWASIRTPTEQYVEWYNSAGATTEREYYDLNADPWQLVNLYRDGNAGNDPPFQPWSQQLASLRTCAGAGCVVAGEPVPQPPVARISAPVCSELACRFDGSSSSDPDGGTLQSFAWDFGDGTTGTGAEPQHTFSAAGTYSVTLRVTDDENTTGEARLDVTVSQTPPPVPVPPVARISAPMCSGLVCSFNGSTSSDPDGGALQSFAWDFGDGTTGTGASLPHTFAAAGDYLVKLTVTDDENTTGDAQLLVSVSQPPPPPVSRIAFRGSSGSSTNYNRLNVAVPSSVRPGDGMLLFASAASTGPTLAAPTGWTQVQRRTDGSLQTVLWRRVAPQGAAGSTVTVTSSQNVKLNATLLAYSGTNTSNPIAAAVSAAEAVTRAAHTTPVVTAQPGEWVVSYWADRTGNATGWTAPPGVTVRQRVLQTGGGRVTSLAADGGAPSAGGQAGGLTANSASNGTATMWTVRLAP